MAVRSGKQLMGSGGHRPLVGMNIDEKELKQIINDLDKLLPHNRGTKTIVKQAMRKAMKAMRKGHKKAAKGIHTEVRRPHLGPEK